MVDDGLPLAEARLRALVEQIPAITFIDALDENESTLYVSPQLREVLGFEAREWIERPDFWASRIHPDDRNWVWAEYVRRRDAGEPISYQYRLVARDGRTVWVDERAVPLRDEAGTAIAYQGVLFDITLLKEREDRLRRLDAEKALLIHAVSHDLKNPLFAIDASLRVLLHPDLSDRDRTALMDGLLRTTRRAIGIVTDLLDLDAMDRGSLDLVRQDVAVDELVAEAIGDLQQVASATPFTSQLQPAHSMTDPARLRRVIDNLLVNAVEHTPDGAGVHVEVEDDGEGVIITVADEGPGLNLERARQLLSSQPVPGEGLGLSIVARFCAALGARIDVVPSAGACFRVWLPIRP